jgi:hypothetical protein
MAIENTDKKAILNEELYLFRHEKVSITRNTAVQNRLEKISADYISAIFFATKFLQKRNKITPQILCNIIGCYNHYQIANSADLITIEHKEQLRELLNLIEFKELLSSPENLSKLYKVVNSWYISENKKIYFFDQSFGQWIKELS